VPASVFPVSNAHCTLLCQEFASASVSTFKACRARLDCQLVHEVLIAFYEAVTERVLGRTYALQTYPEYLAFILAPLSSRPGPLPFLPLPTPTPYLLSHPSLSESLSLFFLFLPLSPACDRPQAPAMVLVVLRVTF
jgi:hypothetical protein